MLLINSKYLSCMVSKLICITCRSLTPLHCAADKVAMDCLELLVKHNCMVCSPTPPPSVYTLVHTD